MADTSKSQRNFSNSSTSSHQFIEFTIKTPRFNLIIARLTTNTYVLIVLPPGEAELECTRLNVLSAKDEFSQLDGIAEFRYRESQDVDRDNTINGHSNGAVRTN